MIDFSHLDPNVVLSDPWWLITQFLITFLICLALGKVHELLHVYKAKKLGYKITSYKLWKNEVDVDIKAEDPNVRKIGMFPYVVLVPLGWLLLPLGWYLGSFGVFLAGLATVIIHGLSLRKEGVET